MTRFAILRKWEILNFFDQKSEDHKLLNIYEKTLEDYADFSTGSHHHEALDPVDFASWVEDTAERGGDGEDPYVEYQKRHRMVNYHFKLVFRYLYMQIYLARRPKEIRLYCNLICMRCLIDALKNFGLTHFTWKHAPSVCHAHKRFQSGRSLGFQDLDCKYAKKNKYWVDEVFSFIKNLLKIQFISHISSRGDNPHFDQRLDNFSFFELVQTTFSNNVTQIPLKNLADQIKKMHAHPRFEQVLEHLNVFFEFFFGIFLAKINIKLPPRFNSNDVNSNRRIFAFSSESPRAWASLGSGTYFHSTRCSPSCTRC